jgi:hypothetical protein
VISYFRSDLWLREVLVAGLLSTDMFNLSTPDGRRIVFKVFQGECQSSAVYAETTGTREYLSSVEHREFILKNGDQTRAFHLQGARLAAGAGHVVTIVSAERERARSAAALRLDWAMWTVLIAIIAGIAIMIFVDGVSGFVLLMLGLTGFFGVVKGNLLLMRYGPYVLAKNHTTDDRFLWPRGRRIRLIVGRTWLQMGAVILMLLGIAAGLLLIAAGWSDEAASAAASDARIFTVTVGLIVLASSLLVGRALRNKTRRLQMLFDDELLNIERAADRAYAQRPMRVKAGV